MQQHELVMYKGKWALYWREDGLPRRRSLGTSNKQEALRLKAEFERIEQQQRVNDVTVGELWRRYHAALDPKRSAAINMPFEAKAVLPHFGHLTPLSISDEIVEDYTQARRAAGKSDGTILKELTRLATVMSWGVKKKIIADKPHIQRPRRPPAKDRFLTRQEARRLLIGAKDWPHVHLFIVLALTTAARAQAILDLEWSAVDFTRGLIDFRIAADQPMKGRVILPMNESARKALEEAQDRARSNWVIEWAGRKVGSVKKGVAAAARRAGLDDVTPHVFRHTAAVWMAEAGRPMSEIAQALGHTDERITFRVYARYSPDHLRNATAALELV